MRILLFLLLAISLNAKSFIISNIPIPKNTIINLDYQDYNDQEIENLYENGYVLTLLSLKNLNEGMNELLYVHKQVLNIDKSVHKKVYQIAFFMPKKAIGKYATSTINSAIVTMLSKNLNFEISVFDATDFEPSYTEIEKKNYDIVIAPITNDIAFKLCQKNVANKYYIPTLHKKTLACKNKNLIFGAIDYEAQVKSFESLINEPITLVSNKSLVTTQIDTYVEQTYEIRQHLYVTNAGNLKDELTQKKDKLHEKVIFLNLPLVEATLFLSQLPLYEIEPKAIYSTQILYNPNILRLTQYNDRKNLILANSIKNLDQRDVGNANLLRNDLRYDWVDFTTMYGLAQILEKNIDSNQIKYEIKHIKPLRRNFVTKE